MAEKPPTSRISRSTRLGGLVAGQSARWVGTRAANVMRSPERADAATGERAAALARELVEQLGQMRGAAMKVGQVLSTIDFTALPEGERENFKQTLAALRDDVPPLPFKQVEKLLRDELGEKPSTIFASFEEEAFAAASIGQVHRADPFAHVPEVHTGLSSRRVLVTDLLEGARFEAVKARDAATRDRFGEIVFRFYFGLVRHMGRVSGDPHPGNYLLLDDGRVGFLDFGLMRVLDRAYLDAEAGFAVAVEEGDAPNVHALL